MEAVLRFTVTNQQTERTDEFPVVEGSENYLQAQFTFTTPDWDGLVKTGVFIDEDGDAHTSLCTGNICDVPPAWLKAQRGAVGVIGSDGTTKITTSAARVRIREKGYTGDGGLEEDAKGYFDQIMQAFAGTLEETGAATDRAENAEKSAEGWAHGHGDFPERAEDNAMYYSDRARNDAASAAGSLAGAEKSAEAASAAAVAADTSKEEAASLTAQAQTAAGNAMQSEQNAKEFEEAAAQSAAAAGNAEGQAGLFAQQSEEAKDQAEQAKAVVMEIGTETAEDKASVRQMADNFGLLHQQAVADVNNAGQAQTERVEGAGTKAQEDINAARARALLEVEAAGAAQTEAVSAAGTAQVSSIRAEGDVQAERVQEAAAEIIADREQIGANRQNIQNVAIKKCVGGNPVILPDSAEMPFAGLRIYGRTQQRTTTGAQLFDTSKLPSKTQSNVILTNNGDGSFTIEDSGQEPTSGFSLYYIYSVEDSLKLFPAGTYKISSDNVQPYYCIQAMNKDDESIMSSAMCISKTSAMTITDEMVEAQNYKVRIGFYKSPNIEIIPATVWPIIQKGTEVPTEWEPYTGGNPSPSPDYPQELVSAGDKGNIEVKVEGKNLIMFPYASKSGTLHGITYEISDGGIVTANGTTDEGTDFYLCEKITLHPGTYMLSGMNEFRGMNLLVYDVTEKVVLCTLEAGANSKMFVVDKKYTSVMVYLNTGRTGVEVAGKAYPMLQIGTEATAYEPYRTPQTLTMFTPNGLPGIPVSSGGNYTDENGQQWVADYRDWERGVDVQMVRLLDLTQGYKWSLWSEGFYINNGLSDIHRENRVFSLTTHFRYGSKKSSIPTFIFTGSGNNFSPIFYNTGFETINEWKAWIEENGLQILYILAEPIETPIPAEELAAYRELHTNYPTTIITSDEECHMEVGYVADPENYINQNYVPRESYNALEQRVAAIEAQVINNI